MIILTLNTGSSSAKYQVYDWTTRTALATGLIERIGQKQSNLEHNLPGTPTHSEQRPCPNHNQAISWILSLITDPKLGCIPSMDHIKAVGHRVVHGGETFTRSVIITDQVLGELEACQDLAPLHNPANISGIKAARDIMPDIPHCAILDTAWHQTMPPSSYHYALPWSWYTKHKIRRYGFHGTSYIYTSRRAAALLGKQPHETNLIIAHIGNGSSICAVKNGTSLDTSMGLTPLEGLIMGTRSGDIDPAVIPHIMQKEQLSPQELSGILNKESGILGITEQYLDRRDIATGIENGNERCSLALDMETYRIKKYIGAYTAALGSVHALVFTAGVGEMNPLYRAETLRNLQNLGYHLDPKKNALSRTRNGETCISTDSSPIKILVIPTDEELVMTEDSRSLTTGTYTLHTDFTYSFQKPDYTNPQRHQALSRELGQNPELQSILALPPGV